jgi:OmpA-OmpF porin, OOP family
MKHAASILLILICCTAVGFSQQKDDAKCKDHPLFNRMQDSWIHHCSEKEFDAHTFDIGQGKSTTVEGRKWKLSYYPQATATSKPSELQILRNFENAVKQHGGKVLAVGKSKETLILTRDGMEFWVEVTAEFTGKYGLTIVERSTMKQDIVASAEALADDLRSTGRCIVNGIFFDTGKAELKPESGQALAEIAKLLKADAGLNVYVVGHTDNAGRLDANMTLSQNRAGAVVQALTGTYGIAASRLKSFGNGPYAPVASNNAEDGRALNRRVELVKQ